MKLDYIKEQLKKVQESSFRGTPKVETQKYSWGTMKTIHHGMDFSIPLHPEHHQAIAKLNDGESHSFKDETKANWTATRDGENVNFKSKNGYKTSVPMNSLKEETDIVEGYDDEVDVDLPQFKQTAAEKALGQKRAAANKRNELLKGVTRKVTRSNYTHDSSADEEDHAIEVNKKITAGADHPWIPKPIAHTPAQAKTINRGVTTKQETKASSARKELQAALRNAKTAKEKAALRAQYRTKLGEETELEEMAMGSKKNAKGQKVEWNNIGGKHMVSINGQPAHQGFLNHADAAALYKKHLGEGFEYSITKNGVMYEYSCSYEKEIILEGKTVTKVMAENIIENKIDSILEQIENLPAISDIISYAKTFAKK